MQHIDYSLPGTGRQYRPAAMAAENGYLPLLLPCLRDGKQPPRGFIYDGRPPATAADLARWQIDYPDSGDTRYLVRTGLPITTSAGQTGRLMGWDSDSPEVTAAILEIAPPTDFQESREDDYDRRHFWFLADDSLPIGGYRLDGLDIQFQPNSLIVAPGSDNGYRPHSLFGFGRLGVIQPHHLYQIIARLKPRSAPLRAAADSPDSPERSAAAPGKFPYQPPQWQPIPEGSRKAESYIYREVCECLLRNYNAGDPRRDGFEMVPYARQVARTAIDNGLLTAAEVAGVDIPRVCDRAAYRMAKVYSPRGKRDKMKARGNIGWYVRTVGLNRRNAVLESMWNEGIARGDTPADLYRAMQLKTVELYESDPDSYPAPIKERAVKYVVEKGFKVKVPRICLPDDDDDDDRPPDDPPYRPPDDDRPPDDPPYRPPDDDRPPDDPAGAENLDLQLAFTVLGNGLAGAREGAGAGAGEDVLPNLGEGNKPAGAGGAGLGGAGGAGGRLGGGWGLLGAARAIPAAMSARRECTGGCSRNSAPMSARRECTGGCSRNSAPTTPRQRLRANELRAFGCSRNSAPTTPRQRLRANDSAPTNSAPTNSAPGWPYQQPDSAPSAAAGTPRQRLRANDSAPTTPRQRLRANDSAPTNSAPTNSAPGWPYQQPDSAPSAAAGTPRQRLRAFGCSPIPAARLRAFGCSPIPAAQLMIYQQPAAAAAGTPRRDGHISSPIPAARLRANELRAGMAIPAAGGCCSRNSAPTTPRQRTPRQRTPRLRLQPHTSSPINDIPAAGGCCSRNSAPGWPYQQPHTSSPTPRQRTPRRDGHTSSRRLLQPELRANDSAPTTPRQRLRANELRAGMAIPAARLRAFGCSPIPAAQLMIYQQPAAAAAGTPRQRTPRRDGHTSSPTPRLRLQPHTSSPINDIPAAGGCCSRNSAPTNSAPSAAAPYQQPPRLQPELRANDSAPIVAPPVGQGAPELRAGMAISAAPYQQPPRLQPELRANDSAPTNSAPGWPYQQPDSAPSAAAGTPRQRLRANDSAPTTPRQRTPRRDGHTSSPTPRLRLQPELRANDSAPSAAAPYQQPN